MNKLFHIFRVDEEEAKKISGQPDEPHNHDFEELLIGIHGELEHFIDASKFYTSVEQVDLEDLNRWLEKSKSIQWDYKKIVKRKGELIRIK